MQIETTTTGRYNGELLGWSKTFDLDEGEVAVLFDDRKVIFAFGELGHVDPPTLRAILEPRSEYPRRRHSSDGLRGTTPCMQRKPDLHRASPVARSWSCWSARRRPSHRGKNLSRGVAVVELDEWNYRYKLTASPQASPPHDSA